MRTEQAGLENTCMFVIEWFQRWWSKCSGNKPNAATTEDVIVHFSALIERYGWATTCEWAARIVLMHSRVEDTLAMRCAPPWNHLNANRARHMVGNSNESGINVYGTASLCGHYWLLPILLKWLTAIGGVSRNTAKKTSCLFVHLTMIETSRCCPRNYQTSKAFPRCSP